MSVFVLFSLISSVNMAESSETLKSILKLLESSNPSISEMNNTGKIVVLNNMKEPMDRAIIEELEQLLTTFWTKIDMEEKLKPIEAEEKSRFESSFEIKAQHLLKYKEYLIDKMEKRKQSSASTQSELTDDYLKVKNFINNIKYDCFK